MNFYHKAKVVKKVSQKYIRKKLKVKKSRKLSKKRNQKGIFMRKMMIDRLKLFS